jgi:malonate-semialdehyde dehydrogenase (acetylating) / methylmalonate-semialdehyde dehydrogenase
LQGYENGFFLGGRPFDEVTTQTRIYRKEIFGPVISVVRSPDFDSATKLVNDHEYGYGTAISPATAKSRMAFHGFGG